MSPSEVPFWDAVDRIRTANPRYRREAYGFLMLALGHVVSDLPPARRADPDRRHVSGLELVNGVVELARREFGVMAPAVFREWGVLQAADLGEIVFELVECGQLSARPEDRREDFDRPDLLRLLSDGLVIGGTGGAPTGFGPRGGAPESAS